MEIKISIKPLSVNKAWKGVRYKTLEYSRYERLVLSVLPNLEFKNVSKLSIEFGFSNKASDIDNPLKPILDILQKKYKFNDKDIYELNVKKVIVPKSKEFISILLE